MKKWAEDSVEYFGSDSTATLIRLGLIFFRVSMIISSVRFFCNRESGRSIICSDDDFENARKIASLRIMDYFFYPNIEA